MVGGVSIGAFMGALWCQEKNITTVTQKAREWSKVSVKKLFSFIICFDSTVFLTPEENDSVVASDFGFNISNDFNV